jgi:hypothetical protein
VSALSGLDAPCRTTRKDNRIFPNRLLNKNQQKISAEKREQVVRSELESLAELGQRNRVLVVPPDQSGVHSRSGDLTRYAWEYYTDWLRAALPALGTHAAMQTDQIARIVSSHAAIALSHPSEGEPTSRLSGRARPSSSTRNREAS